MGKKNAILNLFNVSKRAIENYEQQLTAKDLEADLLTASTRDTAQLELIGKLEAENKRLREAVRKAVYHWMYRIDYHHVDSHKTRKLIDDALSKDSNDN